MLLPWGCLTARSLQTDDRRRPRSTHCSGYTCNTKSEILAQVWPDTIVGEACLEVSRPTLTVSDARVVFQQSEPGARERYEPPLERAGLHDSIG